MANIDVTYGDEPKPLSKEESAKLLKLYEEQQQRLRGEGEDLLNVQEVIVLIDEDEDAENLRRLRAAACEKFAKEQLEKKLLDAGREPITFSVATQSMVFESEVAA